VAEARSLAAGRFELAVTTLAAHLAASPTDGLPSWSGELRSGAHANLLMGVTSNRTDVRQAAARAERALERIAEPLAALLLPADQWPQALLDEAWLQLIRNAAHDSVCACSIDPVVDAVLHRYAEAEQIAEGLTLDALAALGPRLAHAGPVAVNSTGRTRSGLVTVKVVRGRPTTGGQVIGGTAEYEEMFVMPAANAVAVLGEILDWTPGIASVTVEDSEPEVRVEIDVRPGRSPVEGDGRPQAKAALAVMAQADRARPVRAIRRQLAVDEVLVRAADVPAFGWVAADPAAALSVEAVTVTEHETHAIVANGLVTVEVGPRATFAVNGIEGFGRIVDDGDAGDTYNWCPPDHDLVVTGPQTVHWRIVERGPLRARVEIEATYIWPARHDDASGRRVGERATRVVTTIEIQAGDPLVRVTIAFDNQSDDHRVRVWLPLPQPAITSRAECAFTVVERGLEAEGGPTEVALATFPSRRFVAAGGLTVVHEGLPEYELVDRSEGPGGEQRAHAVALTLLRATGWLSRGPMTSRPLPAGPMMALRGSQVHGPHELRFALHVADADADNGDGDGDGHRASDPYDLVDAAFVPLLVTYGHGVADGVATPGQALALTTGAAVVSSVTRRPGGQQVRLYNPTAKAVSIEVPGPAVHVDLRDRPIASIDGVVIVRPEQIVTVVVADATI
jgi:mannosylglycerate hydrolase